LTPIKRQTRAQPRLDAEGIFGMTSSNRYSPLMITLHWVMAILMVALYLIGERFEDLPRGPAKLEALLWHVYAGLAFVFLIVARLIARRAGAPGWPPKAPVWQHRAALVVHVGLYAVMIVLVLSGLVAITSGRPLPLFGGVAPLLFPREAHEAMEEVHEFASKAFVLLAAVHVAATLFHAFKRDGLAMRMTPRLLRTGD
jgi:cytochrome b561